MWLLTIIVKTADINSEPTIVTRARIMAATIDDRRRIVLYHEVASGHPSACVRARVRARRRDV